MEHNEQAKIRQTYMLRVTISAPDQAAAIRRLRAALKYLGRVFFIQCVYITEDALGIASDEQAPPGLLVLPPRFDALRCKKAPK